MLAHQFHLSQRQIGWYHDRYFDHTLPTFSKRTAKVRLRQRRIEEEEQKMQTAQIIYTRASELTQKDPDQFRFFPLRKEKLYLPLPQQMPGSIEEIEKEQGRNFLQSRTGAALYDLHFLRHIAKESELLVAVDAVTEGLSRPFHIVEVKVRNDTRLLREAMRYVMLTFPVLQTTYSKADLAAAVR